MRSCHRYLAAITGALLMGQTGHVLSQTNTPEVVADVISATAEALGAKPSKRPVYIDELREARKTSDRSNLCFGPENVVILTPQIIEKAISYAISNLKSAQAKEMIRDRPNFARDMIVVGIASFEAGRLAAASPAYRAEICS